MNSSDRIRKLVAACLDPDHTYRHKEILSNVGFGQIQSDEGWTDDMLSKRVSSSLAYWIDGKLNVGGYYLRNVSTNGNREYRLVPVPKAASKVAVHDGAEVVFTKVGNTQSGVLLRDAQGNMWTAKRMR